MPLSWNEIKSRALAFTNEWKNEVSEDAEAKSFRINFNVPGFQNLWEQNSGFIEMSVDQ